MLVKYRLTLVKVQNVNKIQKIFRRIQTYSEPCATKANSKPWYIHNQMHIQNPGIFRSLRYLEFWHIQNPWYIQNPDIVRTRNIYREPWYIQKPGIFRMLLYSEPVLYSELWHIQNAGILRTLAYQNQMHFQKPITFGSLAYSEPEVSSNPAKHLRWSILQK